MTLDELKILSDQSREHFAEISLGIEPTVSVRIQEHIQTDTYEVLKGLVGKVLFHGATSVVSVLCDDIDSFIKQRALKPGSEQAVEAGCLCPVLDNSHGGGYLGNPNVFVYSSECKIHE